MRPAEVFMRAPARLPLKPQFLRIYGRRYKHGRFLLQLHKHHADKLRRQCLQLRVQWVVHKQASQRLNMRQPHLKHCAALRRIAGFYRSVFTDENCACKGQTDADAVRR